MSPEFASVVVAAIAAVSALAGTWMTARQTKRIDETHKQVTVNHHSSDEPTVLDRIDDVKVLVLAQGQILSSHIAHSNDMDLRLLEIESEVRRRS